MIEPADFDAIERTIREWHKQRGPYRAEQESELIDEHIVHVAWVRMWAQRAGVVAEQTQAEESK